MRDQGEEDEIQEPVLDDTTDSGSETASEEDEPSRPATNAVKQPATVTIGLGGLNRAQMERERHARVTGKTD